MVNTEKPCSEIPPPQMDIDHHAVRCQLPYHHAGPHAHSDADVRMNTPLSMNQARDLAERYLSRRERFPDEDEQTAFLVVVLNFGDHLTAVSCIAGEWTGIKAQLAPRDGVPLCPNGHPLLESHERQRLGLVAEELPR